MTWNPYYALSLGVDPFIYAGAEPARTASSFREHRGPIPGDRGAGPAAPRVTTPPFRPPVDHRPSVKPPVTQLPQLPVTQLPITQPQLPVTQPPRRPEEPPRAHHHHGDYVFVPGYDWWPSWFPYWDPYWHWYWQYLYWYYQGYAYPEYAEWARDAYLRSIAPQVGWYR